jgi:hypothetical protein
MLADRERVSHDRAGLCATPSALESNPPKEMAGSVLATDATVLRRVT